MNLPTQPPPMQEAVETGDDYWMPIDDTHFK
jgi:hypothetical protein